MKVIYFFKSQFLFQGKDVPDLAVLNMKANFVLPDVEETFFSGVFYTELPPNETSAIVTQYNAEAISQGEHSIALKWLINFGHYD